MEHYHLIVWHMVESHGHQLLNVQIFSEKPSLSMVEQSKVTSTNGKVSVENHWFVKMDVLGCTMYISSEFEN